MGDEAMEMRCMSACVRDSRMHNLNGIGEDGLRAEDRCGARHAKPDSIRCHETHDASARRYITRSVRSACDVLR
jgi:hypothetical protein